MVIIRAAWLICSLLVGLGAIAPLMALAAACGALAAADGLQMCLCRIVLLGLRMRVRGRLVLQEPTLLVANHVSWLDILVIGALTPVCFLAKSEVAAWPIVGSLGRAVRTVFVDRQRRRSIIPANLAMAERLAGGRSVLLFAEGTTSAEPVLPFRTSHIACLQRWLEVAGAPQAVTAQGVAIRFSHSVAAWVGEETLVAHLGRLLQAPGFEASASLTGPHLLSSGFDRKSLGRQLRAEVTAALAMQAGAPASALPHFMMGGALEGTGRVGNST